MLNHKLVAVVDHSNIVNLFFEITGLKKVYVSWPDGTLGHEQDYLCKVYPSNYKDTVTLDPESTKTDGDYDIEKMLYYLILKEKIEDKNCFFVTNLYV